jgi:hypothetical protein
MCRVAKETEISAAELRRGRPIKKVIGRVNWVAFKKGLTLIRMTKDEKVLAVFKGLLL